MKAGVDESGHQTTVVSTNRLNPLTVHLVVGLRSREKEPRVPGVGEWENESLEEWRYE